jgi:phage gp45-like
MWWRKLPAAGLILSGTMKMRFIGLTAGESVLLHHEGI